MNELHKLIEKIGPKTLYLRQAMGSGTSPDGTKFTWSAVIPGGSIIVEFEDPEKTRYRLNLRHFIEECDKLRIKGK